jgi:SAM-dependent methyltransferase
MAERAVVVSDALADTARAFDGVAARYDRSNTDNPILCAMRERMWRAVDAMVPRGAHLLDLGCGPGADAERFARLGYRVTAIDWSEAMVEEARRRVAAAGCADRVEVQRLGIHELDRLAPPAGVFDAALSNFGPLNCVVDLRAAAQMIAARLRPGGVLVASVIGRLCPWEIALYATRGQWSRAMLRFRRGMIAVPLEARTVWTQYYSPREFEAAFTSAGLRRVALRALGVLTPPPYLDAFARRHDVLVSALERIEDRVAGWPGVRSAGDHFLIALRKG